MFNHSHAHLKKKVQKLIRRILKQKDVHPHLHTTQTIDFTLQYTLVNLSLIYENYSHITTIGSTFRLKITQNT